MTLAAGMLRERDAPLGALSRQLGYASEYAFAAAFKRAHGVAPGRYRLASRSAATARRLAAPHRAVERERCYNNAEIPRPNVDGL